MTSHLLHRGVKLWNEGKQEQARTIFKTIIHNDRANESAWLWYIYTLESDKERIVALQEFLTIAPGNEKARLALEELRAEEQAKTAPLNPVRIERREDTTTGPRELHDPDSSHPEERKPQKPNIRSM